MRCVLRAPQGPAGLDGGRSLLICVCDQRSMMLSHTPTGAPCGVPEARRPLYPAAICASCSKALSLRHHHLHELLQDTRPLPKHGALCAKETTLGHIAQKLGLALRAPISRERLGTPGGPVWGRPTHVVAEAGGRLHDGPHLPSHATEQADTNVRESESGPGNTISGKNDLRIGRNRPRIRQIRQSLKTAVRTWSTLVRVRTISPPLGRSRRSTSSYHTANALRRPRDEPRGCGHLRKDCKKTIEVVCLQPPSDSRS